jgi:hypothetical protein
MMTLTVVGRGVLAKKTGTLSFLLMTAFGLLLEAKSESLRTLTLRRALSEPMTTRLTRTPSSRPT